MSKRISIHQLFWFFSLMLLAQPAGAFIELNAFYSSESLTRTTSTTAGRMLIDFAVGFGVDKNARYNVGWNYSMHTGSDASGTTTTAYSSTQMGPRFLWVIDKSRNWSLGLGYYLVSAANFEITGSPAEKWKGTAIKADLGYSFPLSDSFYMGVRLNYSSASFAEKLIGSSTYEAVGYTKVYMYPSVYSVYYF